MTKTLRRTCMRLAVLSFVIAIAASGQIPSSQVGREVAIPVHLQDGEEFTTPVERLIPFGAQLFNAKFTIQEGAGRPLSKGTGCRSPKLRKGPESGQSNNVTEHSACYSFQTRLNFGERQKLSSLTYPLAAT